jgi:hypothetical protein
MKQASVSIRAVLAAVLCVTSVAAGAQSMGDSAVPPAVANKQKSEIARGDPSRWYTGDASYQSRLRTLKKEIVAAYDQGKRACTSGPGPERAACLKDARSTYEHDLAQAPELARNAPAAGVTEKVIIQEGAPSAPPSAPNR